MFIKGYVYSVVCVRYFSVDFIRAEIINTWTRQGSTLFERAAITLNYIQWGRWF